MFQVAGAGERFNRIFEFWVASFKPCFSKLFGGEDLVHIVQCNVNHGVGRRSIGKVGHGGKGKEDTEVLSSSGANDSNDFQGVSEEMDILANSIYDQAVFTDDAPRYIFVGHRKACPVGGFFFGYPAAMQ